MDVSATIDWISATFTQEGAHAFLTSNNFGIELPNGEGKGKHGYNRSKVYETGVLVMWSDKQDQMGVHVVFSGTCLSVLLAQELDGITLLRSIRDNGGRTSRVDFAYDVRSNFLHPTFLGLPERSKTRTKGRTPKSTIVNGTDGSATRYVGSRQSPKFLRIYDKAKEQKLHGVEWIRVELEMKEEVAHAVGWLFAEGGIQEAAKITMGMIDEICTFDCMAWEELRSSVGSVTMSIPKKSDKDTYGWLLSVCAPALAKVMASKPSVDVLRDFNDALLVELRKLGVRLVEE